MPSRKRSNRNAVATWVLAALVSLAILMPASPSRAAADVKIEWLTWSFFRITTPGGKVILTNPWYKNPDSKTKLADIPKADIILVPTGHPDEIGQTVEIAKKTGAKVVATHELAFITFKGKIPLKQTIRVQPGSTVTVDGIRIRVVGAVHGNGQNGAAALGFFITFENGYTLYFSGSTDVTLDMRMWGERFKPDAAILYLPGAMNPDDFALMTRLLSEKNPNLKTVIPHHNRVKPPTGSADADLVKALTAQGLKVKLLMPQPRKVYVLSK